MSSDDMGDEEKAIAVTVLSAIVVLAGLLVYTSLTPLPQKPFISLYYLDSGKKTENLPELLILGENNTVLLWVGVENYMGKMKYASVLVKIGNETGPVNPSPADPTYRFEKVLLDKETWEFPLTITIDQTGTNRIIFELWLFDEFENVFIYSKSWCSLWLDVLES